MFKPEILISATVALILFILFIIGLVHFTGFCGESDYPSINYSGEEDFTAFERNFEFRGNITGIKYKIDKNLYISAGKTDKSAYLIWSDRIFSDWHSRYYDSFINCPEMNSTYSAVLSELIYLRDKNNLSSDEYAELITVFVQTLPYFSDMNNPEIKYPVETLYEGWGDCDDRSLLLAGLLAKSGYNISLFYFEQEGHMGVGIASENNTFKGTGYAYIETVDRKIIGDPDMTLPSGKILQSYPEVIRIQSGNIRYS
jgi:hypothetical protein